MFILFKVMILAFPLAISSLRSPTKCVLLVHAAFFQSNSPIYSAKAVRFRMGHRILPEGDEEDIVHEGQECAEEKFVWTYTSPEFPMAQVSGTLGICCC